MSNHPTLARRLGTADAVVIGLGSMIGAGVFAAFTPAAAAAGSGLLVGLVVAAFVAFCNATSSAQLAAAYPTSGGTYVYGRERLGPWPGYLAGWGFIIGKTSFDEKQLVENYAAAQEEILRLKPSTSKGRYVLKGTVATTMGPGIPLDTTKTRNLLSEDAS